MAAIQLSDVPGIGPLTADRLRSLGITDVAALAAAEPALLAALPGFHSTRAQGVITAAQELLRGAELPGPRTENGPELAKPSDTAVKPKKVKAAKKAENKGHKKRDKDRAAKKGKKTKDKKKKKGSSAPKEKKKKLKKAEKEKRKDGAEKKKTKKDKDKKPSKGKKKKKAKKKK